MAHGVEGGGGEPKQKSSGSGSGSGIAAELGSTGVKTVEGILDPLISTINGTVESAGGVIGGGGGHHE